MRIWTDQDRAELRRLWNEENLSVAAIANRLGVTRNAVIGQMARLHKNGIALRKPAPPKPKPVREKNTLPSPPRVFVPSLTATETQTKLRFRSDTQCPYPLWADCGRPDFLVCGAAKDREAGWCESCSARVYTHAPGKNSTLEMEISQ